MLLKVKYKSQFDKDADRAKGDCMETSLAMVAGYVLGKDFSTNDIVKITGSNLSSTTLEELQVAGGKIGLSLNRHWGVVRADVEKWLNDRKPIIAIINYEKIKSRQDVGFKGGHAVVIVGIDSAYYFINDPDHWGDRRKMDKIARAEFESAWNSTSPKGIEKNGSALVPKKGNPAPVVAPLPPTDPCADKIEQIEAKNAEVVSSINKDLKTAVEANIRAQIGLKEAEDVIKTLKEELNTPPAVLSTWDLVKLLLERLLGRVGGFLSSTRSK